MSEEQDRDERPPLLRLGAVPRIAITLVLLGLAGLHAFKPDLGIDGVFLGLLAFAGFVYFFDIESLDWQGIRARKRVREAKTALEVTLRDAPGPPGLPSPKAPEITGADAARLNEAAIVHTVEIREPSDPLESLLWNVEQIRVELTVLAGNSGRLPAAINPFQLPISTLVQVLQPTNSLRPELISAANAVNQARNIAVHRAFRGDRQATDLAKEVLSELRAIPRAYIRVARPDVPLFRDRLLETPHDAKGVMLIQIDARGTVQPENVYPRRLHYERGDLVTWQWDMSKVYEENAFFRHHTTGQGVMAFGSAAVFVGRPYPKEWDLVSRLPAPDQGLLGE